MAVDLVFAPEAELDVARAYAWYEGRRVGLGEEFLSSLDASVESIRRRPKMCSLVYESYRRALIRRFPYAVFYEYAEATNTRYFTPLGTHTSGVIAFPDRNYSTARQFMRQPFRDGSQSSANRANLRRRSAARDSSMPLS